ncbi:cytochrome c biogenesis protein DipZ [Patescibacteria group bacterium]|nr:cytochrome c biogenesis protein DipZ [Patescibacteria group bacterium]
MLLLAGFAFIAGIVTILSPCILPLLPIILSSTTAGSKRHPLGVVVGFIASFTFFTLFLTTIVNLTGLSANYLRILAVIVIFCFGLVFVVPKLHMIFEIVAGKFASRSSRIKKSGAVQSGFEGGLFIGLSLGLVWTPCVGPILASVIALALTGSVNGGAVLITLAYAVGTAIPMLIILYGGRQVFQKVPWLLRNLGSIQKVFGVLMILTAIGIFFNWDRQFQTYILQKFPNYGAGLTAIEDNTKVRTKLDDIGMNTDVEISTDGYMVAPEIIPGGEWLNSEALSLEDLRGKVVLIDFWTYSCINCIRTLPYIENWYEKYMDEGFVVIGVHTPEFEFEKDVRNLAKAIDDFGLTYPIVQDNDYSTWRAYNNRFWPAKYFIDAEGRIRDTHFGEGGYNESERLIQDLLKEAGHAVSATVDNPDYSIDSATPETYLGYLRSRGFSSPEKVLKDGEQIYSFPENLNLNSFAFEGAWTVFGEYSQMGEGAALRLRFKAKNVFLVMNPVEGSAGRVEIFMDGESQGIISVDSDRLYEILSLDEPGAHLLELKFLDGGVETYAFTFG